jgi:hypothetical protein
LAGVLDKILNAAILRCPPMVQMIFMERVIKSVQTSQGWQEAGKVLFSEKEGRVRKWRHYRPFHSIRTPCLDLLGLQEAHQQISKIPKHHGGNY